MNLLDPLAVLWCRLTHDIPARWATYTCKDCQRRYAAPWIKTPEPGVYRRDGWLWRKQSAALPKIGGLQREAGR